MHRGSITNQKSAVIKSLLHWYRKNSRPLPWRKTHNPYRILVSEIMLQQTQVNRVIQKYPEFLHRFPTFQALAQAHIADVIRAWSGMGYNNRALRLKQLALRVVQNLNGKLPKDVDTLQNLPGIGRYTAHAVACFAFKQQTAMVDTNVRRVLSRIFPRKAQSMNEWNLAKWILPKGKAYEWNQALMELGGSLCTTSNPQCSKCPVQRNCQCAFHVRKTKKSIVKKKQKGVPDRFYRGRVVTILRALGQRQSIEIRRLAKRVKPDILPSEKKWFAALLKGLQRDGLISCYLRRMNIMVSLPR
jgi:A/G-specific adenine glycosylase